ncbi:hypothetical protein GCM10011416_13560 [Polaribacter pacificus]|uniref:Lipoprotein n=1 Tax=Polaribacter pacificus TaxID=1775173 RepID=A0A917HZT8_9FLAO|nr:hypothetical protein [Polaribacter pacificus]GGG96950.1 hypothetical protein GCM10011416_13560 [Polaribacter pacificus]
MKNKYLAVFALIMAMGLSSCSTNDEDFETMQKPLLKSYELKRDSNGAYSIDFDVEEKTGVQSQKNLNSLTNEFHLSKVNYDAKGAYREDVSLNDNQLKIGFVDAETGRNTKIQVEDENITFAKGTTGEFLNEYSVATNEDGTIQLDFKVKENVQTEFVYLDELDIYQVHLSPGMATENKFSKSIEMPETGVLKIDFVNHKYFGKGLAEIIVEKPKVIIQEGEDVIGL